MTKKGHCIMIKESINQEHIATLKVYVANNISANDVKQKSKTLKGKIKKFKITVVDFNTSLS